MSNFRPIDSKREEFRKYLERSGVMDSLTKALISLYEETDKPSDALEYIRDRLGPDGGETDPSALREEIVKLKERLAQYESGSKTHTPMRSEASLRTTSRSGTVAEE